MAKSAISVASTVASDIKFDRSLALDITLPILVLSIYNYGLVGHVTSSKEVAVDVISRKA